MAPSVTQTAPDRLTTTAHPTDALAHALRVAVLAERVLQVSTDDARASLDRLPRWQRTEYETAAAVALAVIDVERQAPALYAAAHGLVDLGSQTPVQRRGLVQMVRQVVERYTQTLGGHHTRVVAQLEPLIALDAMADTDHFEAGA
jgi:hypothetical protein